MNFFFFAYCPFLLSALILVLLYLLIIFKIISNNVYKNPACVVVRLCVLL